MIEALAPRRLGTGFRWLLGSVTFNNLGDGVAMAAGPLLVASQTSDPFLVSLAVLARQAPHVLFGLHAGAWADRHDRKRQVLLGSGARVVVLLVLLATMLTGVVSIAVVIGAMVLLGVAEVVTDSASRTLLPSLVAKQDLGVANQRTQGAVLLTNQFVGPPLGAFLFTAGMLWPFGVTAVCLALGAVLIAQLIVPPPPPRGGPPRSVHADIAEGVRWLWGHAAIRTLTIVIIAFNITWGAAWGVLVLWARERVGLDEVGFGLLTTLSAVGGLVGTVSYGWLERHVSGVWLMRVCLLLEVLMHLVMATTRAPWVAYVVMVVFGAYSFVWGTLSGTIRQRAVPPALQGRIGSTVMLGVMLGMVIGTPVGGALASTWGITAPNWVAFVGAGATLAVLWRSLRHVAHAGLDD